MRIGWRLGRAGQESSGDEGKRMEMGRKKTGKVVGFILIG